MEDERDRGAHGWPGRPGQGGGRVTHWHDGEPHEKAGEFQGKQHVGEENDPGTAQSAHAARVLALAPGGSGSPHAGQVRQESLDGSEQEVSTAGRGQKSCCAGRGC